jgi:two-component system, NtrC family, response regulator
VTHTPRKLLVVEDDPGLQRQLKWCFEDYQVLAAGDRSSAVAELIQHQPAVVLQDLGLPPNAEGVTEGFASLEEILNIAPHTKVIVVTAHGDLENAVRAIRLGAYDFYQKPVNTQTLQLLVARAFHISDLEAENRRLLSRQGASPLDGIVAAGEAMVQVCRMIEKIAPTDITVLLLGESGTGKELLARALHSLSSRKDERFVAINCAAIPENLLESELFGHEKGAFTDAVKTIQGKIEVADGGTLFLDEIGDMPLSLQAKLLRFLQERVVERVGGREEIPVDVRVICATNQNISGLIDAGSFREDLYYRISEITVNIPPLREREGGRMILARQLLERHALRQKRTLLGFSADAEAAIRSYTWPGNVRELENKIKGAIIMAEGKRITAADMGLGGRSNVPLLNLDEARRRAEINAIRIALQASGDVSDAVEILQISQPDLQVLMQKHGLIAEASASADGEDQDQLAKS